jgi:hypothetical protein
MNVRHTLLGLALVGFAAPSPAQSLVEVAQKEKERRAQAKKTGKAAKVYTDGDTSGNAGTTTPPEGGPAGPTAPAPAAAAGVKAKEKTADEVRADDQKEWADRVKAAQDEIKTLEEAVVANERSLASMINITPARADMATRVETDKKKLADLKAKLEQLEDERRRKGFRR